MFFIVGSARSGTTLLRLMLNAHRDIAVPPESRFIVQLWTGQDEVDAASITDRLRTHKQFAAWELPIEEVAQTLGESARISYATAITAPHKLYAAKRGKSRWGDKTPRYVEEIPLLARLFPDSRFIHVIRDGRNVALSYADVPFGPKTFGQAAALWRDRVRAGMRDGRPLGPDRYQEIHYERLVTDVEAETKALCDFLGVEFDPEILDYAEKTRPDVLPRAKAYNPNVTSKPIANVRSWQEAMSPREIAVFEAIAGDTLEELGYERGAPKPGPATRLLATTSRVGLPIARLHGKSK
jgi:Sulfotransferase family